ncbi:MAG: hypothetical protein ACRD0P_36970, partial [Stackebrandtia sp.]
MTDPQEQARLIVAKYFNGTTEALAFTPPTDTGQAPGSGEADPFASLAPGGSWILDLPDNTPAVWGSGDDVLWS